MLLSEYLKILLDYSKLLSEYLEFPSDFRFPLQRYGKKNWQSRSSPFFSVLLQSSPFFSVLLSRGRPTRL